MKYGVLSAEDFDPKVEMQPDESLCVVLLNDDGSVAIDDIISRYSYPRTDVGLGQVYNATTQEFDTYVAVPLDVQVLGVYDTMQDAIDAALGLHYNLAIRIEQGINRRLTDNARRQRQSDAERRRVWMERLIVCVIIILVLAGLYYMFFMR